MSALSQGEGAFRPAQELLLKAVFLEGEEQAEAWRRWKTEVDFDRLDDASHSLLALLYRKVSRLDTGFGFLPRLKGVYRKTWYGNQALLLQLRLLLEALAEVGAEPLLLGGAALNLAVYHDPGVRPVGNLDFLVASDHFLPALGRLESRGWEAVRPGFRRHAEKWGPYVPSVLLAGPGGCRLNLRRRALALCPEGTVDQAFRDCAVGLDLKGVTVRVPTSTDLMLHALAEGIVRCAGPSLLWAADAMALFGCGPGATGEVFALTDRPGGDDPDPSPVFGVPNPAGGEERPGFSSALPPFDGGRLIDLALRHRLALPLRDALGVLAAKLRAPVPEAVLQALGVAPVSADDWANYVFHTEAGAGLSPWVRFQRDSGWCVRLAGPAGARRRMPAYFRVLQARWNVRWVGLTPLVGLGRVRRRPEGER